MNLRTSTSFSTEEVATEVCSKLGHNMLMFMPAPGVPPLVMCTKCGLGIDEIRSGKMNSESRIQ